MITPLNKEHTPSFLEKQRGGSSNRIESDLITKHVSSSVLPALIEFLHLRDVISLCQANRQWRAKNNIRSKASLVVSAFIRSHNSMGFKEFKKLRLFETTSGVTLFPCSKIHNYTRKHPTTDLSLREIASDMPSLKILYLSYLEEESSRAILDLEPLKDLHDLTISTGPLGYPLNSYLDLSLLSIFTNLHSLNLQEEPISDAYLARISSLTHLTNLNLSTCHNITDIGLTSLSALVALQSLNLSFCTGIACARLSSLNNLSLLHSLDLSYTCITDEKVPELSLFFPVLQYLNLSGCKNLTDIPTWKLQDFHALQSLNLSTCRLADLSGLSVLTRVRSLNLSACVHPEVLFIFPDLAPLVSLRELRLFGLPINFHDFYPKLSHLIGLVIQWDRGVDFMTG